MTALWSPVLRPDVEGYVPRAILHRAHDAGQLARSWWLGARITSGKLIEGQRAVYTGGNDASMKGDGYELRGGAIWKVQERMAPPLHEAPQAWIDAIERAGPEHPSSYADCYHQLAPHPESLPWTFNGLFHAWSGGPWEDAPRPGHHRGPWWRYDLRSAYRWAGGRGLPDPASYEVQEGGTASRPGLWWVELIGDRGRLPETFQGTGPVVLSSEELATYRPAHRILRGVTWSRELPAGMVERVLSRLPCHKESGRAYWGRWVAREALRVWTKKSGWCKPLRNNALHFVWGWLIVGRVRARVWQDAGQAAHIYVDELVVPHELPTGPRLGDWHLKEHYPRGIFVERVGKFGPLGGPPVMATGEPRNGKAVA